jgi:glycosyltransferase involved in cell wall biosynthesis
MSRVSIITALHNKGPYVAETIRSVLAQTVPDWEMIVVENGSADNGPDVVRQFSDARIRLAVSPKCGPGAARNFGLGRAIGEWVLFLDADDLIQPDYLDERLRLLQNHSKANLLAGWWEEFKDGSPEDKAIRKPAAYGGTTQDIANAAIAYAPWALHAALVRKKLLRPCAPWAEYLDAQPYEDAAFWFPIVCNSSPVWSDKAGALYRIQTTASRNEIVSSERAIRGIVGAVSANTKYLKSIGRKPNSVQTGNLVRTFEAAYRMALRMHNRDAARVAFQHAQRWLQQTHSAGASIKLRRWLGLRLFNLLRFGAI